MAQHVRHLSFFSSLLQSVSIGPARNALVQGYKSYPLAKGGLIHVRDTL